MDDHRDLLPFLRKGVFGIVTDDKSGFFHVHMHPRCRELMRFHYGDAEYGFLAMAFVTRFPNVVLF